MSTEEHGGLVVETITNGPFMENCFLAGDAGTRKAIVIDPGDEETLILERIRALELDVELIVNTHAHVDHAGAVAPLKRLLGVPFAIHADEKQWLAHMPQAARMFGLPDKEVPEVDRDLVAGESLQVGGLTAEILFTPGHSAGGCCLLFAAQKVVFVGDTLFAGSIGRTDLPGGSMDTLLASIRDQLLVLDDDVLAYSGHGPVTSIGAERRSNPFLQPGARLF
jgi:glyoxylase-like metal-dependent hydrolase (beta-lactamase superfamily II)